MPQERELQKPIDDRLKQNYKKTKDTCTNGIMVSNTQNVNVGPEDIKFDTLDSQFAAKQTPIVYVDTRFLQKVVEDANKPIHEKLKQIDDRQQQNYMNVMSSLKDIKETMQRYMRA
jgi:hypothetical protein